MVELDNMKMIKRSHHKHTNFTVCDSLMRYADMLGYGGLHFKMDKETGLMAIVAINNLNRGPAIGGCRMVAYDNMHKAIEDVLRLGHMMAYKAAITELNHGGAKSVIIKPKVIKDREAFFEKFGEFVDELGGRYITAVDSGTSPKEMDIIARKTKFVSCTSENGGADDPSPLTALGVLRGIEASVKFKLNRDSLEGLTVSVQGTGNVGYHLCKHLHERGAKLIVTDINKDSIQRCIDEFGATAVAPNDIFKAEADIFAPCALGAIINRDSIKQLKVKIVAGSSNNQLAHSLYGTALHERGILYAPDFLINAGGLIHVAVAYGKGSMEESLRQIDSIYDKTLEIFKRSEAEGRPTNIIAEEMAKEKLG